MSSTDVQNDEATTELLQYLRDHLTEAENDGLNDRLGLYATDQDCFDDIMAKKPRTPLLRKIKALIEDFIEP